MQAYTQMERLPAVDFEVGGRRYGVYGHDWRKMPPLEWLTRMLDQAAARVPVEAAAPSGAPPLGREAFAQAVRRWLRDLGRPAALRSNALLGSKLATRAGLGAEPSARIPVIDALVRSAAAALQETPTTARWYQAVEHTYLRPAPTRELAAERLGVSFSSFRRYLAAGLAQIVERLWQQEIVA
jgi:hypothetical protein